MQARQLRLVDKNGRVLSRLGSGKDGATGIHLEDGNGHPVASALAGVDGSVRFDHFDNKQTPRALLRLPLAVDTLSAGPHESALVQRPFDFMLTEERPERVIGDKAYDSDALDEKLAEVGVELIAPHRSNRKPENVTQDGRPLRRYRRRWTVERTISWIQHFRRLRIRWEKSTTLFQGLLHFGCTTL